MSWKRASIAILLVLLWGESFAIPPQRLVKGGFTSIETDYDIGDAAISNGEICEFVIASTRREIYLNPRERGSTALTIWDTSGRKRDLVPIEIYEEDVKKIESEARAKFGNTDIDVSVRGGEVVLSGDALSKRESAEAEAFAARYPSVRNEVAISQAILDTTASKIEAAIAIPGVKARGVKGKIVLEGVVYNAADKKKALEIARLYEPDIIDLIDVKDTGRRPGKERLVKIDVYFMEVKKEALRTLGILWAPGSTTQSAPSKGGGVLGGISELITGTIGFAVNLLPKLRFVRESGKGRVLEHASLIVKSGEAGDFFSGTEVPYYSSGSVSFKEVGIKVHVEPVAYAGDVDLLIDASLSSPAANIEGGVDTRSIKTSAYVRGGEAVVLANVVSNRDLKTYNRPPKGLDTSSAIFNLALSKDFQSGRSEFLLFMVPNLIDDAPKAVEELKSYLSTEKEMIKERSKREYSEFLMEDMARDTKKERRGRRGW